MAAAAWAVPLATAGISALGQSQGGKKAAKKSAPQIPQAFMPDLGRALGLLGSRLSTGGIPFLGPILAGQSGVLGPAGAAGLRDAFNTLQSFSKSGISPEQIALIKQTTDPFYADLRGDLVAGSREATASRFFGSGSAQQEMDTLRRFENDRAAQTFPLALQAGQQQLGAAGSLYELLQSEFMRTQPESYIPALASLMGGTPFYNPAVAPGFASILGANAGAALGSPGFWNWAGQFGKSGEPAVNSNPSALPPNSAAPWMPGGGSGG